jgi:mono/diheme cytochrome c family protein
MRLIAFVLCCVTAIVVAGCNHSESTNSAAPSAPASAPGSSATADPLANARAIYAKECESCHGEKGDGGVVKVDNKSLKVPSLKTERSLKHTDEQYIKQITNGGDGMPTFKDKLKPEEMEALVKLVKRDIQGR